MEHLAGYDVAAPLLRPEEERLLLFRVVVAWDEDRTAESVTKVVLFEFWSRLRFVLKEVYGI
jgi:hypothetical protein